MRREGDQDATVVANLKCYTGIHLRAGEEDYVNSRPLGERVPPECTLACSISDSKYKDTYTVADSREQL